MIGQQHKRKENVHPSKDDGGPLKYLSLEKSHAKNNKCNNICTYNYMSEVQCIIYPPDINLS